MFEGPGQETGRRTGREFRELVTGLKQRFCIGNDAAHIQNGSSLLSLTSLVMPSKVWELYHPGDCK